MSTSRDTTSLRTRASEWAKRIAAASLVGSGIVLGCGTDEGSGFGAPVDDAACSKLFGDRCNQTCTADESCGGGMHCAGGRCSAECGNGVSCPDGARCSETGRCSAQNGGIGGGTDSGTTPDGNGVCADLDLKLGRVTPTVSLIVDRSNSMNARFPPDGPADQTRWTTLKSAFLDDGVIEPLQGEVIFGLTMFANPTNNATCPDLESVPFALNNYAAIEALLRPAGMFSDTPTGETIASVAGIDAAGVVQPGGLAALDTAGGGKVILLVTDGDPDYCGNPGANDPTGNPTSPTEARKAQQMTIDAVKNAFAAGIKTYVMGIGQDIGEAHQQEVANVGLGYPETGGPQATIFRPTGKQELIDQLKSVVTGARSCTFTLNGNVQPGREGEGLVTLNGTTLVLNDANGWRLTSPNEIELTGEACRTVQTVIDANLSVRFPCGSATIVN